MQIKWVWRQMKGFQKMYLVCLFFALVPQVLQLVNPIITQMIVDKVLYKIPEYEGNMQPLVERLIWLLSLMVGVTALRTGIRYFSMVGIEDCGQRFLFNVKKQIYGKL